MDIIDIDQKGNVVDIFTRPTDGYSRNIDIVSNVVDQAVKYLSISTGESEAVCRAWIESERREGGVCEIKDPKIRYLQRESNGDRFPRVGTYLEYVGKIKDMKLTMVPTLTAYLTPDVKIGSAADFINDGIKLRSVHKGLMKSAQANKDEEREAIENLNQTGYKLDNNSYSGAMAIANSILFLASGHPALTSTCRTTTSYANSNNEKLLGGNRHYWSFDITMANLTCIILYTDLNELESIMAEYKLHYPTVEETVSVVKRSTDPYWSNYEHTGKLKTFLTHCTDIQRAAIVYINDLYHLRHFNDSVLRDIFKSLMEINEVSVNQIVDLIDIDAYAKTVDEDLEVMVVSMYRSDLDNCLSLASLKKEKPTLWRNMMAKVFIAEYTLSKHSQFFKVFVANNVLPHTVANVKFIYRRVVVGGDTDSTIFTSQEWVKWYTGELKYSDAAVAVSGVTTFLASKTVAHILRGMSKHMGIHDSRLDQLGLKNEFFFPIFFMTGRAKHYFTYQGMREGVFFENYKSEVKGVGLRGSGVPPVIFKMRAKLFTTVMDQVLSTGYVNIKWLLGMQSALENTFEKSIMSGQKTYLARVKFKDKEQYKKPMASVYSHYDMYVKVFAEKYGDPGPLPFGGVKIPLTLTTKAPLKKWCEGIKDPIIRDKMRTWLKEREKDSLSTVCFPTTVIDSVGIPDEIKSAIDVAKIKEEISSAQYIILESLGLYILSGNPAYHTLVSDQIEPDYAALDDFIGEFLLEDGKDDSIYASDDDDVDYNDESDD